MLWLDAEAVLHFGDFRRLVPAIQEMNRLGTDRVERMLLSETPKSGAQNDWLMLPAWQYGTCFGIKLATVFPGNAARNLASVQGAYLLFDGQTGETLCGMDGAMLTLRKTAANSAAAASGPSGWPGTPPWPSSPPSSTSGPGPSRPARSSARPGRWPPQCRSRPRSRGSSDRGGLQRWPYRHAMRAGFPRSNQFFGVGPENDGA